MWWDDVRCLSDRLKGRFGNSPASIDGSAVIESGAILDERLGPIAIGARTTICAGAVLRGPLVVGDDCLVGNQSMVRGATIIGNNVRIGFAVEIKQSLIGDRVSIGPKCFIGDSRVDDDVYLGALVRTSNQRLDRKAVTVRDGGQRVVTGMDKLGCWIGAGASLGIMVIVLPGRVVAPGAMFEPRITIASNLPTGHYRAAQTLVEVS